MNVKDVAKRMKKKDGQVLSSPPHPPPRLRLASNSWWKSRSSLESRWLPGVVPVVFQLLVSWLFCCSQCSRCSCFLYSRLFLMFPVFQMFSPSTHAIPGVPRVPGTTLLYNLAIWIGICTISKLMDRLIGKKRNIAGPSLC